MCFAAEEGDSVADHLTHGFFYATITWTIEKKFRGAFGEEPDALNKIIG
jgi:hypothetical protein